MIDRADRVQTDNVDERHGKLRLANPRVIFRPARAQSVPAGLFLRWREPSWDARIAQDRERRS
jgi:hypothetical protein